jgi:prepilin-type N-terminal cleavage/methylation domain-containing protein
MSTHRRARGFSLIEALLVLAILSTISVIAIPRYLNQRRRVRVTGDAVSNAKVLQMNLESIKADSGTYGGVGSYDWFPDGTGSGLALVPTFRPQGTSKMNYNLLIANGGLTYTLTVTDPTVAGGVTAYQTNQLGQELARLQ